MTAEKFIALTIWTFVHKVMSLLFTTLSKFVKAFFQGASIFQFHGCSHCLQRIWRPGKKGCNCFPCFSNICHKVKRPDVMILVFRILSLCQLLHPPLSPSSRGSLDPLCFLPSGRYYLNISSYGYLTQEYWAQLTLHPAQHFAWYNLHRS